MLRRSDISLEMQIIKNIMTRVPYLTFAGQRFTLWVCQDNLRTNIFCEPLTVYETCTPMYCNRACNCCAARKTPIVEYH
jgi:hypothetical protein